MTIAGCFFYILQTSCKLNNAKCMQYPYINFLTPYNNTFLVGFKINFDLFVNYMLDYLLYILYAFF